MYTPSRIHKKISIYTIMEPSTETNTPVELVPVAEPVYAVSYTHLTLPTKRIV